VLAQVGRFGDGSNVTEFREGPGHQPQGYSKVVLHASFDFFDYLVRIGLGFVTIFFPPLSQHHVAVFFFLLLSMRRLG